MVAHSREEWDTEISRGGWSLASRNAKNKGEGRAKGLPRGGNPSFNFLLAAAWAANLRLRARFDRKEGRKEGGKRMRGRERNDWEAVGSRGERYKGRNKFLSLFPCDLHAMNFQFDRTDALWCLAPIAAWLTHDCARARVYLSVFCVASTVHQSPLLRSRDVARQSPRYTSNLLYT